jgi:hypothetical protein
MFGQEVARGFTIAMGGIAEVVEVWKCRRYGREIELSLSFRRILPLCPTRLLKEKTISVLTPYPSLQAPTSIYPFLLYQPISNSTFVYEA